MFFCFFFNRENYTPSLICKAQMVLHAAGQAYDECKKVREVFLRWTFLDSFWSQPTGMGWDDSEESIPTQSIHTFQTKRHQGYWSFSFTPPFSWNFRSFWFPTPQDCDVTLECSIACPWSFLLDQNAPPSAPVYVVTCQHGAKIHQFSQSSVQSESYDVDGGPEPKYHWKELKDVKHQSYMLPIKCYPPLVRDRTAMNSISQ